MENPVWTDPYYLKLWMYCLFKASHKEHEHLVGNQMIKLERGQFVTGRFSLAEDLNSGMKPKQKLNDLTWWRYLNNLEKWEMLNIKTTNKFSVVTIDKYDFYQSVFNKDEQQTEHQMNIKRTSNEQQLNTNNNVNKENKKERPKHVYDDASIFYQLAIYFYEQILQNNQNFKKPNLQTWSDDIRKMMEIDKRTEDQIKYLMKWVQQDEFEMANVLCPSKLRARYDQLVIKVKREKNKVELAEPKKEVKRNNAHIEKMKKLHGGVNNA